METYNIEWLNGSIIPCYYITSIFLNRGIVRKYASSQQALRLENMVRNNCIPKAIQNSKTNKYKFSNVPIYQINPIADNNISTWELHSDDGAGHFIVKLYRDVGYIELEVIEELNFLC